MRETIKIVVIFAVLMQIVPILAYVERRIVAIIQDRVGPNRVGPFGLLQPLADAIKFVFKEDLVPGAVDRFLYGLAPLLAFLPPMLAFAAIPLGNSIELEDGTMHLQVADLPAGILFVLAITSVGVYGIALGGWASNNKYSLLGGLRSSAQLISYEITMGLAVVAVLLSVDTGAGIGTLSFRGIVDAQTDGLFYWNVFRQPLACLLFLIAAFAENNRLPFDMPEAEPELVGGYHTEYSGMRFAMFFMGEYIAMITLSAVFVTLFFGGWTLPGLIDPVDRSWTTGLLSAGVFLAKVMSVLFFYMWVRWTLPRFRYDRLMTLGWKVFIPAALANLAVTATIGVLA